MSVKTLRPLEWVLLLFVLVVVLLAGPSSLLLLVDDVNTVRARRMVIALAFIAGLRLWGAYRALPWPNDTGALRRRLHATLPLVAAPFLLVWWHNPVLEALLRAADVREQLGHLLTLMLQVLGVGTPGLLMWLAVGLRLKQHGTVVRREFFVSAARGVAAAAREWLPIVVLISGYAWMGRVMDLKVVHDRDAAMAAVDRALFFGHDPLDLLEPFIVKPVSEWLAFVYSFYAVLYPLCLGAVYYRAGALALRRSLFAVGTSLAIAYVFYVLVPVKGPVLSRTFAVPLDFYLVGTVKQAMIDSNRITFDCFPSMHTCATLLLWSGCYRPTRTLFWALTPVALCMPLSCVYLRYHYVADVLAGAALFAGMVLLTRRLFPGAPSQTSVQP